MPLNAVPVSESEKHGKGKVTIITTMVDGIGDYEEDHRRTDGSPASVCISTEEIKPIDEGEV